MRQLSKTLVSEIGICKWMYLSNQASHPLGVQLLGKIFEVGGFNGHATDGVT